MPSKKFVLGIDLGGTKCLTGLMNCSFRVLNTRKSRVEANRGRSHFLKTIVEDVVRILEKNRLKTRQVSCLGIGCPGIIDVTRGVVKMSPNISFLRDFPLKQKLQRSLHIPVYIENDVNAGLYGEQQFGAARGWKHVLGIFWGTGVGGAMILNGELYRGSTGAAGEIGHTFLAHLADVGVLEKPASLESLIGRLRLASDAGYLAMKQKAPALFEEVGIDLKKIKSKTLLRSILAGDAAIEELMAAKARILGIAMAGAVNLLSPEVIVLGGGLVEAMGKYIVPEARQIMQQCAMPPLVRGVKVVSSKLKDHAILMGAARLAADFFRRKS